MTIKFYSNPAGGGSIINENGIEVIKIDSTANVSVSNVLKQPLAKRQYCSVYASANVPITANVVSKITAFNTVDLDPGNLFDNVNKRYKPLVAGLYEVKMSLILGTGSFVEGNLQLYKNGVAYKIFGDLATTSAIIAQYATSGSCYVKMNGTTDYLEGYYYCTGASSNIIGNVSGASTWFQAILIEAD